MTDPRERVRRQLDLEDEMRALGASRYAARRLPWRVEAGTPDEEANLPPGRRLMTTAITAVEEAIAAFLREACSGKAGRRHAAADFLLLSQPDEIAYLTLRVLVNASKGGSTLQSVAIAVAEAIIENLEFKAFREVNRLGYSGYLKKQEARGYSRQRRAAVKKLFANEGVAVAVSRPEKVAIGTKAVELAVEATGFFAIDKVARAKGYAYVLRTTEPLQRWLDREHARCALLDPVALPMVIRPRRWRSPTHGGYLTKRFGNRLVKQRNRAYHDELRNVDLSRVYGAVNHIQDTRWRINARVLEAMETVWNGGGSLGGLPPREDEPLPPRPADIDYNEEAKREWKKRAAEVHARNAARLSARLAVHQRLWVARRFVEEPAIFFPHECDFRGRVYPMVTGGPTPQGDDSSKALLEFAEGKPLGASGRRWLYIHIANLFGVDKVPFDERVDWTLSHAAELIDSALDPLDGGRFWTTADSPWCALAACFEFVGALDEKEDFVSHLPIALDGSCSGLQHFSAMLRDPKGGAAVNLVPAERPQDVYAEVAAAAQAIADAAEEGPGLWWRGGKVSRSIAKRPTMTVCYSSTRYGIQRMILSSLKELDCRRKQEGLPPYLGGHYKEGSSEGERNFEGAVWLSYVLHAAISSTVVAAAQALDWLRRVAKVAAAGGLPLWWTTPLGLPILQEYKAQRGKRVSAHWAGRRVDLLVNVETERLDSRAQANGVAPNFIHSLDASHLMKVALRAKELGIDYLAVIHDSFGTHAAETDRLARALRETFVELYSGDVLGDFFRELKDQLGPELAERLPPPPPAGDLDLSAILRSPYVFA